MDDKAPWQSPPPVRGTETAAAGPSYQSPAQRKHMDTEALKVLKNDFALWKTNAKKAAGLAVQSMVRVMTPEEQHGLKELRLLTESDRKRLKSDADRLSEVRDLDDTQMADLHRIPHELRAAQSAQPVQPAQPAQRASRRSPTPQR